MELRDEDFDNVNPGEPRFLIPHEGGYPAQFIGYEARHYPRWGEKLIFRWKVFTSLDRSTSHTLCRYYNLTRDPANRFRFGPLHDYRKDWIAGNGGRHLSDRSRLPLSLWQERLFLLEVVTVRQDLKGNALSPSLFWSKIGRVLCPLEESESWERLPVQLPNTSD